MASNNAGGASSGSVSKVEPVAGGAGTAKIIHPDDDISLVRRPLY